MSSYRTRKFCTVLCFAAAAFFCFDSFAQLGDMFAASRKSRKDKADTPTQINADSMYLDIAHDKATLLGNVDIQDPEMSIKCRKMIIYLGKSDKAAEKKTDSDDPRSSQTGKEVVKIECIGDVVITRAPDEAAGLKEAQQAFAGRAVYMVKQDEITLTEDPVVVNGASRLNGERIILYTKTERVLVFKGVIKAQGSVISNAGKQ